MTEHPILVNGLLIVALLFALGTISLYAIDIFTEHGKTKTVPNVVNMSFDNAVAALEEAGFKWEVSDSVYNDAFKPGHVVEQMPKAKSEVKSLRTIFITINAFHPRRVSLPRVNDVSVRQGQTILEGAGFKNIKIRTVPSPYDGLILSVSVNGRQVEPGTKLLLSSNIELTVGDGAEQMEDDLSGDTIDYNDTESDNEMLMLEQE